MSMETMTKEEFLNRCDTAADMIMLAMEYAKDNEFATAVVLVETAAMETSALCGTTIKQHAAPKLTAIKGGNNDK